MYAQINSGESKMSFLRNCRCVRVFGKSEFRHSDVLSKEEYFFIAYDGMCFDRDGFTIIGCRDASPDYLEEAVYVDNEVIKNYLIGVKL